MCVCLMKKRVFVYYLERGLIEEEEEEPVEYPGLLLFRLTLFVEQEWDW